MRHPKPPEILDQSTTDPKQTTEVLHTNRPPQPPLTLQNPTPSKPQTLRLGAWSLPPAQRNSQPQLFWGAGPGLSGNFLPSCREKLYSIYSMCTYIYIYICMCIVYKGVRIFEYNTTKHTCVYVCMYIYIQKHAQISIDIDLYKYTYIYIYTDCLLLLACLLARSLACLLACWIACLLACLSE